MAVCRIIIAGFAAASLVAGAAHAFGQESGTPAGQEQGAARTAPKRQNGKKWLPANFRSSGQGQDAGRAAPEQGEGLVIKTKSTPPRAENPAGGSGGERQVGTNPDGGS